MPASEDRQAWITERQLRLGREWATSVHVPHINPNGVTLYRYIDAPRLHMVYRHNWRRRARWYDLEALRRYDHYVDYGLVSWQMCHLYAFNTRWLLELLDNGVRVIGRRFEDTVRDVTGLSFDKYMNAVAERVRATHGERA